MKVLITGSSGNIGSRLVRFLGDEFELAGLDRVPPRAGSGVAGYVGGCPRGGRSARCADRT